MVHGRRVIPFGLFCLLFAGSVEGEEKAAPAAVTTPTQYDALVTDGDRAHWSFQAVERPDVPVVKNANWPRNPIDNFILTRLEAKGWEPSPAVSGRTLLRRLYLDVVGVPPTIAEQDAFPDDPSPEGIARAVDGLLARRGYGERWARHWLDVVRFAETNGYERDAIKPHAWRFRDWVIDSLNADKPYDRFVLEQLAGDELPDADTQTVIATGYYRLGPWDDEPADPAQDQFDQYDDLVRTTSRAFLGLTLGCSRCHNHKFDSLTMLDYYRMVALFRGLERPRNGRTELDVPAGSRDQLAIQARRDAAIAVHHARIEKLRREFRIGFLEAGGSQLSAEVLEAFAAESGKRSPAQRSFVEKHQQQLDDELAKALPAETKHAIADTEAKIVRLRTETPDLPRGYFQQERSPNPPPTNILLRGSTGSPGPAILPGFPSVLAKVQPTFMPDAFTSRRRLTFARWVANANNPLTARVIVNRVWMYHFGAALVRTPSDFGVIGDDPTHPQLLDWLAHWFVHEADWSLKKLHRLIVTSSTYRMSKKTRSDYLKADPRNELFWRFPYKRLEVEAIRDSMLAVSGRLNRKMHGPSTYLSVPAAALEGHSDPGKIWKPLDEREASRRTVYAFIKRSMVVPMLEVLDLCDTTRSSASRNVTSVPTQALTLFNGEFVNRQARHFAARLIEEVGNRPVKQIDRAYRLALCRTATPEEQAAMTGFLKQTAERLQGEGASAEEARRRGLERVCLVVLNLNEFVYPD